MRTIKYIVLHCTAGSQSQKVEDIKKYWKDVLKWKQVGYHHLIEADGTIHDLQPIEKETNGVAGYNKNSIHISCIGGIDKNGKAIDNRTLQQESSQLYLIDKYSKLFPNAVILGHRDFSTDKNGNGIIDSWERIKECPCYDVREWLEKKKFKYIPSKIIYKLNYPLIKNNNVLTIQNALIQKGYKVIADKIFGKQTHENIIEFQSKNNLKPTGIVDVKTQQLLGINI